MAALVILVAILTAKETEMAGFIDKNLVHRAYSYPLTAPLRLSPFLVRGNSITTTLAATRIYKPVLAQHLLLLLLLLALSLKLKIGRAHV